MAWGDAYYGDLGSVPAHNYLQGSPEDLPDLNDEGLLTHLAKSVLLPPIQLLASTLDKPGRAVRGLLGGQGPSALLNLIPFSDTIGLTQPNNAPSGRDLLRQAGAVDKEDTWGNWLGGLGVDILTDPLNLVSFGTKNALTALGADAAKAGTLASTAAGRIAAKQSGLMALRTPFWMDMIPGVGDALKARLPLLTGDTGQAIATGVGKGVDYLMHEAPYISKPLSWLESVVKYGTSWQGDRRLNQAYGPLVADTERGFSDAAAQSTIGLTRAQQEMLKGLTTMGVPEDLAKTITAKSITGAREGGASQAIGEQFTDQALQQFVPNDVIRDQLKTGLRNQSGFAAEHYGDIIDKYGRDAVRDSTGMFVADASNPWGLDHFHRQSTTGTMRRGSQQTTRTLDDTVLYGGTNQLNDLVSNPEIAGIANRPIPQGMSPNQWRGQVAQTIEDLASKLEADALAQREPYFQKLSFTSGLPTEIKSRLSDDAIKSGSKSVAEFVANINPDVVSKGWGYFTGDPLTSALEYTTNLSKQVGPALGNLSAIAKAAKPAEETLRTAANPSEFVTLSEALDQIKQNAINVTETSPGQVVMRGAQPERWRPELPSISQAKADAAELAKKPLSTYEVIEEAIRQSAEKGLTPGRVAQKAERYMSTGKIKGVNDQEFGQLLNDFEGKTHADVGSYAYTQAQNKADLLASRADARKVMRENTPSLKDLFATEIQGAIKPGETAVTGGGKYSLLQQLVDEGKVDTNLFTTDQSLKNWQIAKQFGGNPTIERDTLDNILKNQVVPRDLVETITKEAAGPGYQTKFGLGELVDKITSGFRTGVTVGFPSYHARNVWEGLLQQGLGGGLSPTAISDAGQYLAGTIKDPALSAEMTKYAAEALATGAAFRNQTMHALGESALSRDNQLITPLIEQGKSTTQGVTDALSRFKSGEGQTYLTLNPKENTWIQAGVKTHNDIDNLTRFSQYVELRRQGLEPAAARDTVMASQMDYSKLTPAELKLRQLIPFYGFSKQNLVRFGEQVKNPGPINALLQGATQSGQEDYVPGYVSQGASVATPGLTAEGKKRYISGFSLPFEDELFGAVVDVAGGHPWEGARRALTSANPLIKLAATVASGRQLYSGRSLDEVSSPLSSLGIAPGTANAISETLSATPLGRLFSTINSSIGSKDQNLLLKLATGIKTTDVDQQMATQMAARDAVAKALQSTGMVSTSQNYSPSKDFRDPANQPEQLQYLLQLMRALEQQGRQAAQARMNQ